jgi:hypothetical protein
VQRGVEFLYVDEAAELSGTSTGTGTSTRYSLLESTHPALQVAAFFLTGKLTNPIEHCQKIPCYSTRTVRYKYRYVLYRYNRTKDVKPPLRP